MSRSVLASLLLLVGPLSTAPALEAASNDDLVSQIEIPFQKFVLNNGLRLIVHEDHKAPIVAVNVWYHVGSKNEKPGKTGFAHLFEHLMFNGSENFNDEYFKPLEKVGATDLNGTTNRDRTNYFQNVPKNAVDLVLWMESDRMGHLLGVVTQEKLDAQRGVVQNEKRQGENQPYGRAWELIARSTYPQGHPYSWTTIGSMEDLNAATLEDVKEWFNTYYGAANAVIVVAGDVDTAEIKAKVEKYFGHIPSGPPISKQQVWVARRTGTQRQIMQDRVPQARIYKVWNTPQWGSEESELLDLVTGVLGSGKTSRLYRRLVHRDQTATDVNAFQVTGEIGSQVFLMATARPGQDLKEVEQAMDEELARFLREGPSEKELEIARTETLAEFVRGAERIGGFGGKSDILAVNEVYGGRPDYYKTSLKIIQEATPDRLQEVAREWLSDGQFVLEVHPFPEYKTAESDVDRSKLPEPGVPPAPDFPTLQRATLSNGLNVVLAERHTVPLVSFRLILDAGYAADVAFEPGTAFLTLDMLDEGTESRTSLQISEELALLGANLSTFSNVDTSNVFLSALKTRIRESLEIFADVILHPSFPQEEFERLKKQQLARIQREKQTPIQMALRILPRFLYGEEHPYGNPLTGSGTEQSLARISRETLLAFHEAWFRPNNATLAIVGDTTLTELIPLLEELLAEWKPGQVPEKKIDPVEHRSAPVVYLVDRPDSVQSIILAGHIAPPRANPDELAIDALNDILGGTFTSRINMNLREEKAWAYGAQSVLFNARAQRPFFVYAPVQTDRTKESMQEILKELEQIREDRPSTPEELDKVKNNQVLKLPGTWETIGSVLSSVSEIIQYGLPDNYYDLYPEQVRSLDLQAVSRAAQQLIHPGRLVWVVVGDRAKIEPGIRELNLGPVHIVDADGNPAG